MREEGEFKELEVLLKNGSSYLSPRRQFTVYNNIASPRNAVTCGLPQGLMLGLLLLLTFMNIIRCSGKQKFILFADDTNIFFFFFQGRDIVKVTTLINKELVNLSNWIKSNNLTLNSDKSQYMISHPSMETPFDINISMDNVILKQVNEAKFLGIITHNKLKWRVCKT